MSFNVSKKIIYLILAIVVFAAVVGGGYWWRQKSQALMAPSEFSGILENFDPIDSPIDKLVIPDLNIEIPLEIGSAALNQSSPNPEEIIEQLINIKAPEIKVK